jgi:hypothetical protein
MTHSPKIAAALMTIVLLCGCAQVSEPDAVVDGDATAAASAVVGHGFTGAQDAYVAAYLAASDGQELDLERLVTTPSELSHEDMSTVFAHPDLGVRGLEVMVDLMKPEGSMYFDAIFGPNYGQQDIRNWLIPTMLENSFLEFRPAGPGLFFSEDGQGGTSVDEWVMVAKMGDQEINLGDGISVRRYRDGWIVDAIDVYDTAPSRMPPPADAPALPSDMPTPPPLPPYPVMDFTAVEPSSMPLSADAKRWVVQRQAIHAAGQDHANSGPSMLSNEELHHLHNDPLIGMDPQLVADMMHPTDSVYIDPLFGRFEGQADIRAWYTDIMNKVGDIKFEALAPIAWNGTSSLQMWRQYAQISATERVNIAWGFSVRRFKDGWITYAADYFDTARMSEADVQAASKIIGSRIAAEDIMRYRLPSSSIED